MQNNKKKTKHYQLYILILNGHREISDYFYTSYICIEEGENCDLCVLTA